MIHTITGTIIDGDKIGRTLGFRTANISYDSSDLSSSVFKVNILINGKIYSGMGVHAVWKKTFEVHIFDFDENIYGEKVTIYVLKKIRDNQKFESLTELKEQLTKDKNIIQDLKLNILTFGSFDVVHEGHGYYLSQARKFGDYLITIIATDVNIERIKGRPPLHTEQNRKAAIEKLDICDEVLIGSEASPMQWLEKYNPYSICLGYDQRGRFVDALPKKLKELGLETEIVRIESLEPEKYKSSLLKKKDS